MCSSLFQFVLAFDVRPEIVFPDVRVSVDARIMTRVLDHILQRLDVVLGQAQVATSQHLLRVKLRGRVPAKLLQNSLNVLQALSLISALGVTVALILRSFSEEKNERNN